jgi:hypothetical protein
VSNDIGPAFHIAYHSQSAVTAVISVAAIGCCFPLFSIARFSFGYFVSFYMLSIIAGYLWLSFFTLLQYNLPIARWSAALSLLAFLIPALFATKGFTKRFALTERQVDQLVYAILIGAILSVAYASTFGFHLIGFIDAGTLRSQLQYPWWLNYAIGISVSATIPFCFAWFVDRRRIWLAVAALAIGASFYPVTLNKLTLFAQAWLAWLAVLSRFLSARFCVLLSLFVPLALGLVIKAIDPSVASIPFRLINFRMIALPASALDHYSHFFSNHPLTHFCQIQLVGRLFDCSLPSLGMALDAQYATGNYNGSLFATEGIASVGPYFAPIAAALCGVVIAAGNKASAGLNPKLILLSGAVLVQALMNVPLSVTMISHGAAILFALWFVTPRERQVSESQAEGVKHGCR